MHFLKVTSLKVHLSGILYFLQVEFIKNITLSPQQSAHSVQLSTLFSTGATFKIGA